MEHTWKPWHTYTVCTKCGIIRRADDKNSPCKGVVKMRPMEKPLTDIEGERK